MVYITYFVHGTTFDNEQKLASGWSEVELSPKGVTQAIALAENIKDKEFDIVFCSDLKRAVQSSKLDFYNRDIEIIRDARLRECSYGNYDGKSHSLVTYEDHITTPFPNGESMADVEKRLRDFVQYLKQNYDGKKVAIVSHKAPQLALDVITKNISWQQAISEDWRKTGAWQPGWQYLV